MISSKVTGIGCFAKPETLSRVFKKMVRNYTLGKFENISLLNDTYRLCGVDDIMPLQALITGKTGFSPSTDSDTCGNTKNKKIARKNILMEKIVRFIKTVFTPKLVTRQALPEFCRPDSLEIAVSV